MAALGYTPSPEIGAFLRAEYLAMLEAYLDESERAVQAPRLFCMAAWLGDAPSAWRSFDKRWLDALDGKVSEFKASDFANRTGEFDGWSVERANALLGDLLIVIRDTDIIAVEVSIALHEPEDRRAHAKAGSDYLACAYHCLLLLLHVAAIRYADGERVGFMFDERSNKGVAQVFERRKQIKAVLPAALAKRFGAVSDESSREILPLQAADLLAYWVYLKRQKEEFGLTGAKDDLLSTMSPILGPQTVLRRRLTWGPGFLQTRTDSSDDRWDIREELPEFHMDWFKKPNLPREVLEIIWDSAWERLRHMSRSKPGE